MTDRPSVKIVIKTTPEMVDVVRELAVKHGVAERVDIEVAFTCPRCDMTSHHPVDAEEGYCGNCHAFTGRPVG